MDENGDGPGTSVRSIKFRICSKIYHPRAQLMASHIHRSSLGLPRGLPSWPVRAAAASDLVRLAIRSSSLFQTTRTRPKLNDWNARQPTEAIVSTPSNVLLEEMKKRRCSISTSSNRYGNTSGVVHFVVAVNDADILMNTCGDGRRRCW